MTTQAQTVVADLKGLIAEGGLSVGVLAALTRIESFKLEALVSGEAARLSSDESSRLSILTSQLTSGLEVDDDERLSAILDSLVGDVGLTLENISRLTRVDVEDLESVLTDPGALTDETRYRLALRASYLVTVANQARSASE